MSYLRGVLIFSCLALVMRFDRHRDLEGVSYELKQQKFAFNVLNQGAADYAGTVINIFFHAGIPEEESFYSIHNSVVI